MSFLRISEDAFIPASENKDKYGRLLKSKNLKKEAIPTLFLDTGNSANPATNEAVVSMEIPDVHEIEIHEHSEILIDSDDTTMLVDDSLVSNNIEGSASPPAAPDTTMHVDDSLVSNNNEDPTSPPAAPISLNHSISMISLDHDYACLAPPSATSTVIIDSERFKEMAKKIKDLEKEIASLKKENSRLKKWSKCEEKFGKLFDSDQIKMILGEKIRPKEWSDRAIQEGIEIRYLSGDTAYKFMRNRGFPFPCITSLCQKLKLLELTPGVLIPNFRLLSIMLDNMGDDLGNREASLSYDAMRGNEQLTYNMDTQQIEGYATLPPTFDPEFNKQHYATHPMVFMLARLKRRWKVPVAMFFTHKDSFTSTSVIKELETIVGKAKELGKNNAIISKGGVFSKTKQFTNIIYLLCNP